MNLPKEPDDERCPCRPGGVTHDYTRRNMLCQWRLCRIRALRLTAGGQSADRLTMDGPGLSALEATNAKIQLLKRQAYGYRDEEFFHLKIYALHLAKYALVG